MRPARDCLFLSFPRAGMGVRDRNTVKPLYNDNVCSRLSLTFSEFAVITKCGQVPGFLVMII